MPENKENKVEPVPYIVHESAMAREERKQKHLATSSRTARSAMIARCTLCMR